MVGKVCTVARIGETGGAVGGHDEDHSVSLIDGARHRSRGQQGLVVRVGVDEDEGARSHRHIL